MSTVGFPLLLIPLAIYNIVVFLMPGVSFGDPLAKLTLASGADWPVTLGDMLLALGIVLLLLEIIKAARRGARYLTDHLLSLIVFGAAAAEFALWPRFGTSTYLLLTMLALVDFLSGIALRARRGTQLVGSAQSSPRPAAQSLPAAAEPQFEREAAPTAGATPSAAEAVPPEHPNSKIDARRGHAWCLAGGILSGAAAGCRLAAQRRGRAAALIEWADLDDLPGADAGTG